MAVFQKYINPEHAIEMDVFLRLIRAEVSQEQIEKRISEARPPFNWQYIVHLANRHQVVPMLYSNLKKSGLVKRLPADAHGYLKARYLQLTGDNMRLQQRLVDMVALLESQGVPAVPFKGAVLAQCLYGDSHLRQYSDMDFLVPIKMAVQAREIIQSAGYCQKNLQLTEDQFKGFARYTKALDFMDTAWQVKLDLHWRLTMHTCRPYDYEFCRKRLKAMTLNKRQVSCLSDEDMAVYLCVHGTSHLWENTDTILSVAEYVDQCQDMDWDLVLEIADRLCCRRMVFLGLFLAEDLFEVMLPGNIAGLINSDRDVKTLADKVYPRLLNDRPEDGDFKWRLSEIPFQLQVRDKWVARARYLLLRLLWPTQKDWQNLPLPAGLSFLYFVLRPMGLVLEWIRGRVDKRSASTN